MANTVYSSSNNYINHFWNDDILERLMKPVDNGQEVTEWAAIKFPKTYLKKRAFISTGFILRAS